MSVVVIDVLFALFFTLSGALTAWWLCRRRDGARVRAQSEEMQRAQEVLARLQEVAARVAANVGEHSTLVEEINDELAATKVEDGVSIVNLVNKLVDANKNMRGQLDHAEDKLREQARLVQSHAAEARTDALTHVANRRAFDDAIARCVADGQQNGRTFSLVMLDLDHFKKFNDTYGHQLGDEVLRATGRTLLRKVRENGIAARYGGEEFAVILPSTSADEARSIAARIRQAIEKTGVQHDGESIQFTASCGATEAQADDTSASIIQRADDALYAAKRDGRNCAHWHDGQSTARIPDPEKASAAQSGAKPAAEATVRPAPQVDSDPRMLGRTVFCQHVRSRLAEWKRGGPVLSLGLIEIDDLDGLSAAHGPRAAEHAMLAATKGTMSILREMDLIALYDPRCLALLLPNAKLPDAVHIVERVRLAISHFAMVSDIPVQFTVSIGVVEVADSDDTTHMLGRAELALNTSMRKGGNCTYYHSGSRCAPASMLLEAVR